MIDLVSDIVDPDVQDALNHLINVERLPGGTRISMPVLYPSGACVIVEVVKQNDRYLVSDRGGAAAEADMLGASWQFQREAKRVASEAGIRFDGRDMFVAEVNQSMLETALVIVADCSKEAASHAALSAAERSQTDAKDLLFARLSSTFTKRDVAKDVELIGSSNHKWRVSVMVRGGTRLGLFEPVSAQYVSVVGAAAKFHDFAALEKPPTRVAVVKSKKDFGDFFGVVAAASSNVIEQNADNESFRKLVA